MVKEDRDKGRTLAIGDLASETDYSSHPVTASETEGM